MIGHSEVNRSRKSIEIRISWASLSPRRSGTSFFFQGSTRFIIRYRLRSEFGHNRSEFGLKSIGIRSKSVAIPSAFDQKSVGYFVFDKNSLGSKSASQSHKISLEWEIVGSWNSLVTRNWNSVRMSIRRSSVGGWYSSANHRKRWRWMG